MIHVFFHTFISCIRVITEYIHLFVLFSHMNIFGFANFKSFIPFSKCTLFFEFRISKLSVQITLDTTSCNRCLQRDRRMKLFGELCCLKLVHHLPPRSRENRKNLNLVCAQVTCLLALESLP